MAQALTLDQIERGLALQAIQSWLDGDRRRWDTSLLRGATLALGVSYSEAEERVSNLVQSYFDRAQRTGETMTRIERELHEVAPNLWA